MPQGTPDPTLASLVFWPRKAVQRLSEVWIESAKQLLGAAAVPSARDALRIQSALSQEDFDALLHRTAEILSPGDREAMSTPTDIGEQGLGALEPKAIKDIEREK